ncbi:MAG: hypothetical protein L6416_07190 [Candidatus Omnitrophica bacterium]|nr:hypothetical protein [Candidatus Omnitrophota bacterium]
MRRLPEIANFFSLLYQLFMVRALVPADFGLLDKLMGLTLLASILNVAGALIALIIAGLICSIFPEFILNLLAGRVYPQCIP